MDSLLAHISNASRREILSVALITFLLYILGIVIYRLFLSPLRSIPGPWYASVSGFWLTTHILRCRRCRAIGDLVQKYGPIVRVGPNTIIFVDSSTMKAVYGVSSKLTKAPFYKSRLTNENDHAMTTLEHGPHAIRKKGYAPHYTPTNLALFQPEIHTVMSKMVDILTEVSKLPSPVTDTLVLFRHLLAEINCTHLFLHDANLMDSLSDHLLRNKPAHLLTDAISDFPKRGLLRSALSVWIWHLMMYIPVPRWQKFCSSDAYIAKFVGDRVQEARSELMNGKDGEANGKVSLVSRLLCHKYSISEPVPERDVISECMAHIIAGTDTTSTTLSYILWELSRREDVKLRLQKEIDGTMRNPRNIPDIRDLQKLPFLNAVIKEGLRVYTAVPSPLPRIVPSDDYMLLGHKLPKGTIIASQAWSSHRRPDVFFSPDVFLPDRWINPDPTFSTGSLSSDNQDVKSDTSSFPSKLDPESALSQMSAHMLPFGFGPRVCGGQNMAQIILRITLVTLVRNFDVVAAPDTNERSMEMKDSFVVFPASLQCKFIFVPRTP